MSAGSVRCPITCRVLHPKVPPSRSELPEGRNGLTGNVVASDTFVGVAKTQDAVQFVQREQTVSAKGRTSAERGGRHL